EKSRSRNLGADSSPTARGHAHLQHLRSAILTLDFNGTKRRVLPLMLTDKAGEDNIVKHKVRTPCVTSVSKAGRDAYLIGVTARPGGQGPSMLLRVDAEGRLLNPKDNLGTFYVVGEYSRGSRLIDRFALIASRLSRFHCVLGESDRSCEYQFLNFAERQFSDEVRHQSHWPDPARRAHHAAVDRAVEQASNDPLIRALHRLIVANESSTISPFQIWDAVLADSGLSFGPHQWDIGINPDAQRIMKRLMRAGGLAPMDGYFKSARRFTGAEIQAFIEMAPEINRVMQSSAGQAIIIEEYLAWLKSSALAMAHAALPSLDASKPHERMMLLFYADVDNQYGKQEVKGPLRRIIADLAKRAAAPNDIRKALDAFMLTTPFAIAYPDKAQSRLQRTWEILLKP
ncbi:MAG: hypothetical protein HC855_16380, partial [Rhizobiales bacterium]|nr:hypothetical protein [Hyphomicrobiales bacterium]